MNWRESPRVSIRNRLNCFIEHLELEERPVDVLAAMMRELHFIAAGYRRLELSAPWAISFDQAGLRGIHIVAEGRCEIAFGNDPPQLLKTGDLVIAPRADPHVLRSPDARKMTPTSSAKVAAESTGGRIVFGGGGEPAVIVCGAFVFNESDHPALSGLPRMVHVAGTDDTASRWLKGYVETLMAEALAPGPGSEVVLARLSAALITRVLRHGVENMHETGWLKGLSDPGVARALAVVHDACGEKWTIESLALVAGQSRAAFAERFHALVGEPPMHYLFRRRMREASRLLRNGRTGLARIAETVGYGSEAAFSTAFKRYSGQSPGEYRLGSGRDDV
ncbi:MAG: AraC family transcriptional regulator [Mesorhizobium sp.]|nr:MAG: AraC family transcriptional regulator [Mesorhizobium sp.]